MSDLSDVEVVPDAAGTAATTGDHVAAGDGPAGDGTSSAGGAHDDGPSPLAAVLAGLAVPGLDMEKARHLVRLRAGRRMRRRRVVLGGVGAVCAVTLAIALWPHPDPEQINADGDRTTTTSTTTIAPATTVPLVETTIGVTTVAPSTTVPAVVTTVPITTVPPTTIPANQAMTASAKLVAAPGQTTPISGAVAGQTVYLRIDWSDPDLADAASVEVTTDFRDPEVTLPITAAERPPCGQPGAGASGVVEVPFRYSTPTESNQPRSISIEITACDGNGTYGERQTLDLPVTVTAPAPAPAPTNSRRIVVIAGGDGRSPDAAKVVGQGGVVLAELREPDLLQVLADDGATRASVAAISATYQGPLYLRWGDNSCQRAATDVSAGSGTVTLPLIPGPSACPA